MNKIILIDADILTYQIGYAVETPVYVVKGGVYKTYNMAKQVCSRKGLDYKNETHIFKRPNVDSFEQAILKLKAKLRPRFEDLGTKKYQMYLTASGIDTNYRSSIATICPYKGGRKSKPFHYDALREYMVKEYKAVVIEGEEADDAIGKEQYRIKKEKGDFESTYIDSIDKDLDMLEGWHYNGDKRKLYYIDEETSYKNFYRQTLTGDLTDNIPGLTKILKIKGREKEANEISYSHYLDKFDKFAVDHTSRECYDYIEKMYKEKDLLNEWDEIKQLLWIRRE